MHEGSGGQRAGEIMQKQLDVATIVQLNFRLWNINSLFPRCFYPRMGEKCNGWQVWMAQWCRVYPNARRPHLISVVTSSTLPSVSWDDWGRGEGRRWGFPFPVATPLALEHQKA